MFDKNTMVAFLLIAVVIIAWPYFIDYMGYETNPASQQTGTVAPDQDRIASSEAGIADQTRFTPEQMASDASSPDDEDPEEKKLVFENDKFLITLSNAGGGTVAEYIFKDYRIRGDYRNVLKMSRELNLGIHYVNSENDSISLDDRVFSSLLFERSTSLDTIQIGQNLELSFICPFPDGRSITRNFTFYGDRYDFDMEIILSGFQYGMPDNQYGIHWDSGFDITESIARDDLTYSYLFSRVGDEIVEVHLKEKVQDLAMSGDVMWTSARSKYFAAVLIPVSTPGKSVEMNGYLIKDTSRDQNFSMYMANRNLPVQEDRFRVMITPLSDSYLESFGLKLEKMMNWGIVIIQPISFAILYAMKFLHQFIPNYGLVLIILTVIIKLILYPLTHKSYESMKRMSELQPLMKELQDKHKKNPEVLNREMMALYKKHKVNPAGGCLPLLLQMPVLYGLFIVFRTTIELRGEPFIFWIKDLSAPDVVFNLPFDLPLYGGAVAILPLVMGVTSLIQQKLSTSNAASQNSQQKMLLYFMPVFLVLIFNNFPSGLNLYYGLFNILTILQQKYFINPSIKPVETAPEKSRSTR